jgi:two-component system sensor histidine kinase/response regulator
MSRKTPSYDQSLVKPTPSQAETGSVDKRRLNQLKALNRMGQSVTSSLNLETVFQQVLLQIVRVVHATGASILLPGVDALVFAAACGKGSETLLNQGVPLENSVAGRVFLTGRAVVVSDAVTSKRVYRASSQLTGQQVGSLLAVPLRVENQILGVMEAVHTRQHKFGDDDLRLLETAASWASIAISNARQHADLERRLQEKNEMELARRAAEAANRAKSEFLANISHEIRTPMNAIVGFSHLALKTEPNPKQQDYLIKIQSSAYSLLGILEDILNFSRLETNRLEIEAAPFHLDQLLHTISEGMVAKAEEKGIEMRVAIAPDVPVVLIGDALRLRDVLVHLVDNAVKFTDCGSVLFNVETVKYQDQVVTLRFIIRDTGIGISPQQMAHLFQPFDQADSSTTRKFGGAGLGLAISKRLVDLMGGSIDVESMPSVGSTFRLEIPFVMQPEPPKHQVMPAISGKLRILVVDDDSAACMLFENILRSMKFAVSIVDSGLAALAELERAVEENEQAYDLVIMDWKAAGIGGMETARNIKTDPRLPQPPAIVITTAQGSQDLLHQVEELKLEGLLVKPLSSSLLLDTIQDIFRKRGSQDPRFSTPAQPKEIQTAIPTGKWVLLVEDNEVTRLLTREILENAGISVLEAKDGKEAMGMAEKNAAQLNAVLMDVAMPSMNGYEATRYIRRIPACKDLPIIAMTANAMNGDREKSLAAGMNDHITKPVEPQELLTNR